jgi:hypothetical protein
MELKSFDLYTVTEESHDIIHKADTKQIQSKPRDLPQMIPNQSSPNHAVKDRSYVPWSSGLKNWPV